MTLSRTVVHLLQDRSRLKEHISATLAEHDRRNASRIQLDPDFNTTSAVLFLLGDVNCDSTRGEGPCLILNKRSALVKQPGDLCCPGGGIDSRIDPFVARLLLSPLSPLRRWPAWGHWQRRDKKGARQLALLLAASLREGLEEMRLNPFGVAFLGALPLQRLVMFKREIYPLVGWVGRQRRFFPNWEVADIIYIPLRTFLEPKRYARYQLDIETPAGNVPYQKEFACFLHQHNGKTEVLWGATFRITMIFLELVFRFKPPDPLLLPEVQGILKQSYFR